MPGRNENITTLLPKSSPNSAHGHDHEPNDSLSNAPLRQPTPPASDYYTLDHHNTLHNSTHPPVPDPPPSHPPQPYQHSRISSSDNHTGVSLSGYPIPSPEP